ncbi:MAG: hypothetical protein ACRDL8_03485, partial [Solirubrobacteraceae bacterium]
MRRDPLATGRREGPVDPKFQPLTYDEAYGVDGEQPSEGHDEHDEQRSPRRRPGATTGGGGGAWSARTDDWPVSAVHTEAENGAALLDDVRTFLGRFVAFPPPAALDAVTLWAVHSHLVWAFASSPRLALLSPEPGSGKTRTLEVLELLVPLPMSALSASTPAVFRS